LKTITVESDWTYRTPLQTIDFAPGKHKVSAEIAEAHEKDMTDGSRTAETGTPGDPDAA
jgi:hypothetical protein